MADATVLPGAMLVHVGVVVPLALGNEVLRVASKLSKRFVDEIGAYVAVIVFAVVTFVNVYPLIIAFCRALWLGDDGVEMGVPSITMDSTS